MRRRGPGLWPGEKSLWPVLALVFLLAGLTACGSGEPDPARAGDAAATDHRSTGPAALVPLTPAGEVVLADGFTFTWELPEGVQGGAWRIRVFAGRSEELWQSPLMTVNELEAPPALLLKLQPGRAYTWRVVGNLSSGGRGRGADTRFITR